MPVVAVDLGAVDVICSNAADSAGVTGAADTLAVRFSATDDAATDVKTSDAELAAAVCSVVADLAALVDVADSDVASDEAATVTTGAAESELKATCISDAGVVAFAAACLAGV